LVHAPPRPTKLPGKRHPFLCHPLHVRLRLGKLTAQSCCSIFVRRGFSPGLLKFYRCGAAHLTDLIGQLVRRGKLRSHQAVLLMLLAARLDSLGDDGYRVTCQPQLILQVLEQPCVDRCGWRRAGANGGRGRSPTIESSKV
jgi:hypothetical protein